MDEALNSPLLEDNDIRGAKHILLNISSGTKEVTMDEIYEITEYVQDEAGHDTDLIWGNCFDETLGEKLCVTVIATGFEHSKTAEEIIEPRREKIKVSLEDDRKTARDLGIYDTGYRDGEYTQSYDLDVNKDDRTYAQKVTSHGDPYLKNSKENRQGHRESSRRKEIGKEQLRERNKRINNPQAIIDLENEPAYLRRQVQLDDVPHSSEVSVSRWSITGDEEPVIKKENPYLHDNVD